jgi:hypothetical protein
MWVAQFKSAIGSKLVKCALGRDSQTVRRYELGRRRRLPLTISRGAATAPFWLRFIRLFIRLDISV